MSLFGDCGQRILQATRLYKDYSKDTLRFYLDYFNALYRAQIRLRLTFGERVHSWTFQIFQFSQREQLHHRNRVLCFFNK